MVLVVTRLPEPPIYGGKASANATVEKATTVAIALAETILLLISDFLSTCALL
jgi:hypothetical protein